MTDPTSLSSDPVSTPTAKIADEMLRQVNFARDRVRLLRASAIDHFNRGDIAKAYKDLGGAMAIEDVAMQFNSLRLRIGDGDFDV